MQKDERETCLIPAECVCRVARLLGTFNCPGRARTPEPRDSGIRVNLGRTKEIQLFRVPQEHAIPLPHHRESCDAD